MLAREKRSKKLPTLVCETDSHQCTKYNINWHIYVNKTFIFTQQSASHNKFLQEKSDKGSALKAQTTQTGQNNRDPALNLGQ